MGHPPGLAAASPAFRAYLELEELPIDAPRFEATPQGYPRVERGEVFCRMPAWKGGLCDQRFHNRAGLVRHLRKVHDAPAPPHHTRERIPDAAMNEACRFYHMLMENEEYDGKEEDSRSFPVAKKRGARRRVLEENPMTFHDLLASQNFESTPSEANETSTLSVSESEEDAAPLLTPAAPLEGTPTPKNDIISLGSIRNVAAIENQDDLEHDTEATRTLSATNNTADSLPTYSTPTTNPEGKPLQSNATVKQESHDESLEIIEIEDDSESEVKTEPRVMRSEAFDTRDDSENEDDLELDLQEAEAALKVIQAKRKLAARKKRRG